MRKDDRGRADQRSRKKVLDCSDPREGMMEYTVVQSSKMPSSLHFGVLGHTRVRSRRVPEAWSGGSFTPERDDSVATSSASWLNVRRK